MLVLGGYSCLFSNMVKAFRRDNIVRICMRTEEASRLNGFLAHGIEVGCLENEGRALSTYSIFPSRTNFNHLGCGQMSRCTLSRNKDTSPCLSETQA